MVATVSPAADNYEETLSTLRYADRSVLIFNSLKCWNNRKLFKWIKSLITYQYSKFSIEQKG